MTATNYILESIGGADPDLALTAKRRDLRYVEDVDAIAQAAACRLRLIRGEWPLDTDEGLDWDRILGVGVTAAQIESEIRRVLLRVTGIARVLSVDVTIGGGRLASVQWLAESDVGALVRGEIGA